VENRWVGWAKKGLTDGIRRRSGLRGGRVGQRGRSIVKRGIEKQKKRWCPLDTLVKKTNKIKYVGGADKRTGTSGLKGDRGV